MSCIPSIFIADAPFPLDAPARLLILTWFACCTAAPLHCCAAVLLACAPLSSARAPQRQQLQRQLGARHGQRLAAVAQHGCSVALRPGL